MTTTATYKMIDVLSPLLDAEQESITDAIECGRNPAEDWINPNRVELLKSLPHAIRRVESGLPICKDQQSELIHFAASTVEMQEDFTADNVTYPNAVAEAKDVLERLKTTPVID